jgi:hypothetical protein
VRRALAITAVWQLGAGTGCAGLVGIEERHRPEPAPLSPAKPELCTPCQAPTGSYRDVVLRDHPDGYWRFEETSGLDVVYDEVRATWRGKLSGGAYQFRVPGAVDGGYALRIDDAAVVMPAGELDYAAGSFTVEVWLAPELIDQGYRFVFGKGDNKSASYAAYLHDFGNLPLLQFTRVSHEVPLSVVKAPHAVGQWNHLVFSYDAAANETRLYVDGALIRVVGGLVGSISSALPFAWGRLSMDGGDPLRATLDEAAIYPRALSCQQICEHYLAGKQP